jgi:hypothetical protein
MVSAGSLWKIGLCTSPICLPTEDGAQRGTVAEAMINCGLVRFLVEVEFLFDTKVFDICHE